MPRAAALRGSWNETRSREAVVVWARGSAWPAHGLSRVYTVLMQTWTFTGRKGLSPDGKEGWLSVELSAPCGFVGSESGPQLSWRQRGRSQNLPASLLC